MVKPTAQVESAQQNLALEQHNIEDIQSQVLLYKGYYTVARTYEKKISRVSATN